MPWVVDDTLGVNKGVGKAESAESGNSGVLRDPDFPRTAGANEEWEGNISVVNAGDETDTFRVMKDAGVHEPAFDLNPGESRVITFAGTGPQSFTIKLSREVEKIPLWKKLIIPIGVGVGAVTLYEVAK